MRMHPPRFKTSAITIMVSILLDRAIVHFLIISGIFHA